MKNNKTLISARSRLYTSVLLVLLALVAVTAATVAWFSIADNTKVKSMSLDIVSGTDLRMDLDPHETLEEYVKTLSFDQMEQQQTAPAAAIWNSPCILWQQRTW